jgi:hypothetical protein
MSRTSRFSKRFAAATLTGALAVGFGLTCAGCNGNGPDPQQVRDDAVQQLEQRYPGSPRIRAILEDQKNDSNDPSEEKFLLEQGIRLELSADGLPDGAIIRLFKDRWQINPFAPGYVQAWAVHLAIEYAEGQAKDGLPYGVGESFAVNRMLLPVGQATAKTPKLGPPP